MMSGGEFEYMYREIENMYMDKMEDDDMNNLLLDFCGVLHDLEWWKSGDISENAYRETVKKFKNKWLKEEVTN